MSPDPASAASTQAVWAGETSSANGAPTQVPIVQSVAFGYAALDAWRAVALGQQPGHIYSRNTNPTVAAFEAKIRALEAAEAAAAFSSGMAAISNTLFALLRPGERVVAATDTYGGTNQLFREFLPAAGIAATLCPAGDHEAIEGEIRKGCRIVYIETPSNPLLNLLDIARLAKAAHAAGAMALTDNTVATPINQHPLALGADLVLHSASKYLGGHADALGGVVCGSRELVDRIYHYREITGAALDPFAAYLLLRGMKTLSLRIERQNANALAVARHLQTHPRVAQVNYPGLPTHPQHALARAQMPGGFGGLLSFALRGGYEQIEMFLPKLRYCHRAANLGAVETTVGPPATTSHVEVSAAERAALGIPEALVRYSAGIEDVADLIADLDQALA